MGVVWDYNGKANREAVFNNGVWLLMIVGLYLLWIGLNAIDISEYAGGAFVPIETDVRAWFAFVGGLGIVVPSQIAMEYAFERGSEVSGYGLNGDSIGALSNKFRLFNIEPLARSFETPLFYIVGWAVLSFSAFLPFSDYTLQMLLTFILALFIGPVYSLLVLPAYWAGNMTDHTKYMYIYCILMAALAAVLGLQGGLYLAVSIVGVILILLGQYLDFGEQKRGRSWLVGRKVNQNWSLFGIGNPIFVVGWILLCHAIAHFPDPDLQ
eukprot:scaffold1736_cov127-Cylindrotheca_fusiformis.AAC.110